MGFLLDRNGVARHVRGGYNIILRLDKQVWVDCRSWHAHSWRHLFPCDVLAREYDVPRNVTTRSIHPLLAHEVFLLTETRERLSARDARRDALHLSTHGKTSWTDRTQKRLGVHISTPSLIIFRIYSLIPVRSLETVHNKGLGGNIDRNGLARGLDS